MPATCCKSFDSFQRVIKSPILKKIYDDICPKQMSFFYTRTNWYIPSNLDQIKSLINNKGMFTNLNSYCVGMWYSGNQAPIILAKYNSHLSNNDLQFLSQLNNKTLEFWNFLMRSKSKLVFWSIISEMWLGLKCGNNNQI